MGRRPLYLTWKHFGLLRVLKRVGPHAGRDTKWLCICRCKRRITTTQRKLIEGTAVSCGCMTNKAARIRARGSVTTVGKYYVVKGKYQNQPVYRLFKADVFGESWLILTNPDLKAIVDLMFELFNIETGNQPWTVASNSSA